MPPIQDMTSDASVSHESTGAPARKDASEPAPTAAEFPDDTGEAPKSHVNRRRMKPVRLRF